MLDQKVFGDKLRNHRKLLGMTQEEVGERIGVSAQAVSKWEAGDCLPDCFNLKAISDLYRISADVLLGRQMLSDGNRAAQIARKTKETDIKLSLHLKKGESRISTGIGFFDHMLTALAFYGSMQLDLTVTGDLHVDGHHTVEDVGIVLGQAFRQALGDKAGIRRFASAFVPMDEALCRCVLDVSGRPFLHFDAEMPQEIIGDYDSCLTVEFMRAFATNAGVTLHLSCEYGENAHHITEGLFKALGMAIHDAVKVEGAGVTSTKGAL